MTVDPEEWIGADPEGINTRSDAFGTRFGAQFAGLCQFVETSPVHRMVGMNADCVTVCVTPPTEIVAVLGGGGGASGLQEESPKKKTEYSIVPWLPVPVSPEVITSHGSLEIADHEQASLSVVMVSTPSPPQPPKLAVPGVREVAGQGAAAACRTV